MPHAYRRLIHIRKQQKLAKKIMEAKTKEDAKKERLKRGIDWRD